MNIKYTLGALLSIPLLPIMYFQGKSIRAKIPSLPEAKGTEGLVTHPSGSPIRMLTIGESTIAGVGVATHDEGFSGTLATALSSQLNRSVHWKVYAKSGYTAKRITYKLIPAITESSIDLLVIGLGGNDAFKLNSPAKWRADIQQLIDALKLKFHDTPIVFTNMPPIKEFPAFTQLIKFTVGNLVELLGKELEDLIQNQANVYYASETIRLDCWIKKLDLNAQANDFFSDGVHPSKMTYQTWAKDFAVFLLENKTIRAALSKPLERQ